MNALATDLTLIQQLKMKWIENLLVPARVWVLNENEFFFLITRGTQKLK